MWFKCWTSVYNAGPTLKPHWVTISCLAADALHDSSMMNSWRAFSRSRGGSGSSNDGGPIITSPCHLSSYATHAPVILYFFSLPYVYMWGFFMIYTWLSVITIASIHVYCEHNSMCLIGQTSSQVSCTMCRLLGWQYRCGPGRDVNIRWRDSDEDNYQQRVMMKRNTSSYLRAGFLY